MTIILFKMRCMFTTLKGNLILFDEYRFLWINSLLIILKKTGHTCQKQEDIVTIITRILSINLFLDNLS